MQLLCSAIVATSLLTGVYKQAARMRAAIGQNVRSLLSTTAPNESQETPVPVPTILASVFSLRGSARVNFRVCAALIKAGVLRSCTCFPPSDILSRHLLAGTFTLCRRLGSLGDHPRLANGYVVVGEITNSRLVILKE